MKYIVTVLFKVNLTMCNVLSSRHFNISDQYNNAAYHGRPKHTPHIFFIYIVEVCLFDSLSMYRCEIHLFHHLEWDSTITAPL